MVFLCRCLIQCYLAAIRRSFGFGMWVVILFIVLIVGHLPGQNLQAGDVICLTPSQNGYCENASYSPDDKKIAFRLIVGYGTGHEAWLLNVVDLRTRKIRNLLKSSQPFAGPYFLPNSHEVIFIEIHDERFYKIDIVTGKRKLLLGKFFYKNWASAIALSRDRKRIAILSRLNSRTRFKNIWVANLDGSHERMITRFKTRDKQIWELGGLNWSPHAKYIAFVLSSQPSRTGRGETGYIWSPGQPKFEAINLEYNIWCVTTDGSGKLKQITNGGTDVRPYWSPDGTRLAFIRRCPTKLGWGPQIYVINSDGSKEKVVPGTAKVDGYSSTLSWSPDGKEIVFCGEDGKLYIAKVPSP